MGIITYIYVRQGTLTGDTHWEPFHGLPFHVGLEHGPVEVFLDELFVGQIDWLVTNQSLAFHCCAEQEGVIRVA